MAPPPEPRRPYKRPAISDQQRRRELALQAQSARRADAQARARALASSLLTTPTPPAATDRHGEEEEYQEEEHGHTVADVAAASSKLRSSDARRWFACQIMLPEWMVDAPPRLASDWSVPSFFSPTSPLLIYSIYYCLLLYSPPKIPPSSLDINKNS